MSWARSPTPARRTRRPPCESSGWKSPTRGWSRLATSPTTTSALPNGYPIGTIPTPDTVTVATPEGTKTFIVVTEVDWAVDSASNLSSDKTVRITVSWANPRPGTVSVESSIVGKSALTNAGDVKINIVDSDTSAKVPGATITMPIIDADMARYPSCKVDELERIRDRLLGKAFREYCPKYDSLPLSPIEIPVGKLVPLPYIGQRFLTSKGHIADRKVVAAGN